MTRARNARATRTDWIRTSRQRLGLSQARLGDRLGVSQATVSQWETGRTPPRDEDWEEMEALFGNAYEVPPEEGPAPAQKQAGQDSPRSPTGSQDEETAPKTSSEVASSQLSWIVNFIWGIADDVLRDLYVRGKYRDVILPMTVLRRLDAVLEPTKQAVLDMKASLDAADVVHQDQALRQGCRPGVLQHFQAHPARPPRPRQPAGAQGRLRSLPGRLLAQSRVWHRTLSTRTPISHGSARYPSTGA